MKRQRKEETKNKDDRAPENMQEMHKRKEGGKQQLRTKGREQSKSRKTQEGRKMGENSAKTRREKQPRQQEKINTMKRENS